MAALRAKYNRVVPRSKCSKTPHNIVAKEEKAPCRKKNRERDTSSSCDRKNPVFFKFGTSR